MALVIATPKEIDEYYNSTDVSRSDLLLLHEDLDKFVQRKRGETEEKKLSTAFKIGGAVDCLLTAELDVFYEKYVVSESDKMPSEAIQNMVDHVHNLVLVDYENYVAEQSPVYQADNGFGDVVVAQQDNLMSAPIITPFHEFADLTMEGYEAYIAEALEIEGWNAKWKMETRVASVIKAGAAYFAHLCKNFGKILLSPQEYSTIMTVVDSLKTNKRTARYFDREGQKATDEVTVYLQMPIYFEMKGIRCRALLDMVFIHRDHEGRITSILPIDIKTMSGPTLKFKHSVRKRRYDIQAAMYSKALYEKFKSEAIGNVIEDFMFIVESTTNPGKPLVFQCANDILRAGRYGIPALRMNDGTLIEEAQPGYEQLIDLYLYHQQNGWDEEREIKEAGEEPLLLSFN